MRPSFSLTVFDFFWSTIGILFFLGVIKPFICLHCRYALDVNAERAEDVLIHKRLLHLAHDPVNRPAIEVRLVQVS